MVVTRNQKAKKITFDDDYEVPAEVLEPTVLTKDESELDDDSDEAPEEESVTQAKQQLIDREKAVKEAETEKRRVEREKRRQQDLYNKQQQEQKKTKVVESEIPDLLPTDVIEAAQQQDEEKEENKPVHKKVEEFDLELKKQIQLEKLKKLKTKASIKKGPVHVKVLKVNKGVPKSESKINSKDKWLKRKALNKK